MSKEPYQMAKEFHETFAPAPPTLPKAFSKERGSFRAGFKAEEIVEFLYGVAEGDEAEFSDLVAKEKVLTQGGKGRRCFNGRSGCPDRFALFYVWLICLDWRQSSTDF